MNAPNEFEDRIQRRLDGENNAAPGDDGLLDLTPEQRQYADVMERLVSRLDAIQTPPPPAGTVDDVMAFIDKQEHAPANTAAPRDSWSDKVIHLVDRITPRFEMPQVLRRDGWSVAAATIAIAWFGWLYPQVQQSNPEAMIQPFTQEMVSFADQVQAKSLQITDRIESFANQIVGPILKQNPPTEENSQSEAEDAQNRKLVSPSHRLDIELYYA
ncbi:MAG: hypothetical protein P9L94_12240 [Candidatus Hinthialibacter antarcticus]|nr:hypothetical protein [Candidatus Hinthialibacter antarcticus]